MATKMKRVTISVPADVELSLNALKKETYYMESMSHMIADLLRRGIDEFEKDKLCTTAKENI